MEDKKENKYVAIWMSYESYFEPLSAAEVGRLVLAMMQYKSTGTEPKLPGNERYVWPAVRRDMDASEARQGSKSEKNRQNALKGWEKRKSGVPDEGEEKRAAAKESERMPTDAKNAIEKEKGKEREKETEMEKGKGKKEHVCAESAGGSPPAICLPLNDGTDYPISAEQCRQWAELYPAVDVMQELRKMFGWLQANASKRKTRRGILRFVTGWLAREQDKGPRREPVPDSRNRLPANAQQSVMDDLRQLHELFGGEEPG